MNSLIIFEKNYQFMELDGFAKQHSNGQYTVKSIYYDSPNLIVIKKNMMVLKLEINIVLEDMMIPLEKVLLF